MSDLTFPKNLAYDVSYNGCLGSIEAIEPLLPEIFESISPNNQQLIVFKYRDGLDDSDIASKLGITQLRVTQMLKQAISVMQSTTAEYKLPADYNTAKVHGNTADIEKDEAIRQIAALKGEVSAANNTVKYAQSQFAEISGKYESLLVEKKQMEDKYITELNDSMKKIEELSAMVTQTKKDADEVILKYREAMNNAQTETRQAIADKEVIEKQLKNLEEDLASEKASHKKDLEDAEAAFKLATEGNTEIEEDTSEFDAIMEAAMMSGDTSGVTAFVGMGTDTPLSDDSLKSVMEDFNNGEDVTEKINNIKSIPITEVFEDAEIDEKETEPAECEEHIYPMKVYDFISNGSIIHSLCKFFGADCTDIEIYDYITQYLDGKVSKIPGIGYKYLMKIFDAFCLNGGESRYKNLYDYIDALQFIDDSSPLPEMFNRE